MLNIGHRPTINNGNNVSIEVNILNFSEDIYHKEMRIEFVKYLRPEEKIWHNRRAHRPNAQRQGENR